MRCCYAASICTIFFLVVLGGCSAIGKPHYDVTVKNIGESRIDKVTVAFEGFAFPFGVLPPNVFASYSQHVGPFPTKAVLSWRMRGPAYMPTLSETIEVPSTRPRVISGGDQKYELLFELDGKHVTARYVVNDYSKIRDHVRQFKEDQKRQRSDRN